jgi:hypothetical protein
MLSAYLRTYTSYEQLDINSPSRVTGLDRSQPTFISETPFVAFGSPQ